MILYADFMNQSSWDVDSDSVSQKIFSSFMES
jgi:hypothetical protein